MHIHVTVSGIITSPEQVVPSISRSFIITRGFELCKFLNHGVASKARSPILVTESGIVIDERLVQS